MKLLFENWRNYLNEGMKQAADLPDGVQVRIEDKGGGDIITNLPLCYTAKTIQK